MAIHTTECRVAQRIHRRDPGRWIDVAWAPQPGRLFDVSIKVLVSTSKGVFARVAADITSADANIVHIAMDEDVTQESTVLRFVIQVSVRTNPDVMRIARERPSDEPHHRNNEGGMRIDRERGDY
jgi:GTP pyrophosphokinase